MGGEEIVNRFLYYPDRLPPEMPPPSWAADSSEVWIETEDLVRIHGLWWDQPEGRPAILFLHGNAQEAYSWSLVRRELEPLRCGMLLIDYRGYGKSQGEPSEAGLYSDGRAALGWLAAEGVLPEDTIVFGKSLGGGVACELATGRGLKGLILESTFRSLRSVADHLFPFGLESEIPPGVYDSLSKLAEIRCPLLVIHGKVDALIPVEEGIALFKAAGEPKELFLVEGAGHNDVSTTAGEEYADRIGRWLDGIG